MNKKSYRQKKGLNLMSFLLLQHYANNSLSRAAAAVRIAPVLGKTTNNFVSLCICFTYIEIFVVCSCCLVLKLLM